MTGLRAPRVFRDDRELAEALAADLDGELRRRVARQGRWSIALAGGSTPRRVYEAWARMSAGAGSFGGAHLFFGDERCVPPDHRESNYRMVREALLDPGGVPPACAHRIRGEEEPCAEASRYAAKIRSSVAPGRGGVPRLDRVLLGVGADGHTASLFPGSQALDEKERLCLAVRHPESGQARITITLPLIAAARRVTFVVTGEAKAPIAARILGGRDRSLPAARVEAAQARAEWWLDAAAARSLQKR